MRSILVYRIGSLGDTLVSLPALWATREHFRNDRITLLCDRQVGSNYVLAPDLLRGSRVVDDFLLYPVDRSPIGRLLQPLRMVRLLWTLRRHRFDTLVYLAPSQRTPEQVERDRRFFALAGIRTFIGMDGFVPLTMAPTPREAKLMLARLKLSGIDLPPERVRVDLNLNEQDRRELDDWLRRQPSDGGRRWIAIGPGSKMPAKIWPAERYERVVARLIERYDVWPVIFGGAEDREVGERLLRSWGRGFNAAGSLGLRASAAGIARSALYLGNDTGTMHLAAAGGVRCVAIFSARGRPGQWSPLGEGHVVFRSSIECEGCGLQVCTERGMECILRIGADEVYEACAAILAQPTSNLGNPIRAPLS